MLAALRIGNFKAFAETQVIPIRPITLVFGPNSGGKSSIIHSLAMAHEANRKGDFNLFRTEVGGTAVDLGGFRQFVYLHDAFRDVEWGVELDASSLPHQSSGLLESTRRIGISLKIGLQQREVLGPRLIPDEKTGATRLVDVPTGRYISDDTPRIKSGIVSLDDQPILWLARRADSELAISRLDQDHPAIRGLIRALIESYTTTSSASDIELRELANTIAEMIPRFRIKAGNLTPVGVEDSDRPGSAAEEEERLFPISRGNRKEDLAQALRYHLPRALNDLLQRVCGQVQCELGRFQYLGPLRSYPPRHFAFSNDEDKNWFAGGGYAWNVLHSDSEVRAAVNSWLGAADRLKTPYEVIVRNLVAVDGLEGCLEQGLQQISESGLSIEPDYDDQPEPTGEYPVITDPEAEAKRLVQFIDESDVDRLPQVLLSDRRTGTLVSHRDVGIGVSQVLPVLVGAYGSRERFIAIEQPEIHLHPRLQAELGDVFIESALGGRGNTFLLETHSEHIILRLLRRIRETAEGKLPEGITPLSSDKLAVLYVRPGPTGVEVVEIPLTNDGEFAGPWPDGFFAERARELM